MIVSEPELLDTEQAAQLITEISKQPCSCQTLRRYARAGSIPFQRIGTRQKGPLIFDRCIVVSFAQRSRKGSGRPVKQGKKS